MGRVAAGDEDALRELCRRWERPLHQFLHRWTGGRDVEDLYQETWLRVVRAARRFDRTRTFSTWLFQIALNLARDFHRSPPPEPGGDDAAGRLVGRDDVAAVEAGIDARRLLAALPDDQRAVVLLRYYHDLPEDAVAEIVGCPRGTVKSRLHTAMTRLAALARATTEPAR